MEKDSRFDVMVSGIPSEDVPKIWPFIEHLIERALAYDRTGAGVEDIYLGLVLQNLQLWMVRDDSKNISVAVTEIEARPHTNLCRILLLAGSDVDEWLGELLRVVEVWARDNGCTSVEAVGRKGWERVGKQYGYQYAYTVIQKKLGN